MVKKIEMKIVSATLDALNHDCGWLEYVGIPPIENGDGLWQPEFTTLTDTDTQRMPWNAALNKSDPNVQQYVSMGHDEIVNVSTYVLHMVGKLNLQAF